MPVFASLASTLLASGTIASLDLCADEYLLMFAPRSKIASVSRLAADPDDSVLASRAKGIATNDGSLESLLSSQAKTLVTTRPLARLDAKLAKRLGIRVVTLETGSPETVARTVRKVATLTGEADAANEWTARYRRLVRSDKASPVRALWIGTGGIGMDPGGGVARWMALAGVETVAARPGLSRVEQVVAARTPLILRSVYRGGQYSLGAAALDHPLVRKSPAKQVNVDGRRFICSGPLMLGAMERLRTLVRR